MKIQSTDHLYTIEENQLMRIESGCGWIIDCQDGTLLITQPGFARDYVLRKGESLRLNTNGRVLVGGATNARFKVGPPHTAPLYPNLIREASSYATC